MSLKSKIEAVIYASEEPVTLQQLVGLLAGEAQTELDALAAAQAQLPLGDGLEAGSTERQVLEAGTRSYDELDVAVAEALEQGEVVPAGYNAEQGTQEETASAAVAEAVQQGEVVSAGSEARVAAEVEERLEDGPAEFKANAGTPEERDAGTQSTGTAEVPEIAERAEGAAADGTALESAAAETGDAAAADTSLQQEEEKRQQRERDRLVREHVRRTVDALTREYAAGDHGIEIREVANGFRMGTKPEVHDAVRGFVKSLKPAMKLTLPALETLAVVAYKQPVTAAEISEIRGVDSAGVLGGLMARKLIGTAGRKQVIGRPMLYKTTRDFLLRFGLKDVNELPSMEEFERMAGELAEQEDLPMEGSESASQQVSESAAEQGSEGQRFSEEQQNSGPSDQEEGGWRAEAGEASVADMPEEAPVVTAADAVENILEKATAESAAGGNDDEGHEGPGWTSGLEGNDGAEGGRAASSANNAAGEEPQAAG